MDLFKFFELGLPHSKQRGVINWKKMCHPQGAIKAFVQEVEKLASIQWERWYSEWPGRRSFWFAPISTRPSVFLCRCVWSTVEFCFVSLCRYEDEGYELLNTWNSAFCQCLTYCRRPSSHLADSRQSSLSQQMKFGRDSDMASKT